MKWNKFLIGAGVGLLTGLLVNQSKSKTGAISAEKALSLVKKAFTNQIGKVDGSWIHIKPEEYSDGQLLYSVYKGGITTYIDDKLEQFDFIVDAQTGTILNLRNENTNN